MKFKFLVHISCRVTSIFSYNITKKVLKSEVYEIYADSWCSTSRPRTVDTGHVKVNVIQCRQSV